MSLNKFICLTLFLALSCFAEKPVNVQRIISLAPSITDTLYTLGLESKLVGITNYCPTPPSGKKITLVGSMNPALEGLVVLKPDLVITLHSDKKTINNLNKSGIKTLNIHNDSLEKIYQSYIKIGELCGADEAAQKLVDQTKENFAELAKLHQGKSQKSLVLISRLSTTPGKLAPWVASNKSFYGEILAGLNSPSAVQNEKCFYQIPAEELILSNPDLIIILTPRELSEEQQVQEIKAWQQVPTLSAVREKKIFFIGNSHIMIPGPKISRSMNDFSQILQKASHEK
ncbi:helical backbone metal receptor [Lentisphaera marina]|uniref:ABC transporter substrate-binding protein n=1 Tax=Lentisphaera marina TaxID=1111041 RepID=UPI002365418E|nr:helical backbone metal receptor [Lentisphaera marina]MDD7986108.1 helical backbone metal receptor [Lentisphaera marina]